MKTGTIFTIMALAFSTAALAQVATAPTEQKVPVGNTAAGTPGNDMLMTDNSLAGPTFETPAPAANATAEPVPGDPVAASSAPPRP